MLMSYCNVSYPRKGTPEKAGNRKRGVFLRPAPWRGGQKNNSISIQQKAKKHKWKDKQIRKHIQKPLSQTLLGITRLPLWPRHGIYAWYITYTSWYIKCVCHKKSSSQRNPQYHWGRWHPLHKHANIALTKNPLSPSSHHHIELCPQSPLE